MDTQREKDLVGLMEQYDVKGVRFGQAKKELLAKGYTEAEIVYALYSAPFDGKANVPRPANPLQKIYESNPDRANKIAKDLLQEDAVIDWRQSAADSGAAVGGPDIQSRSYYSLKAADDLGIPYFTIFFGSVLFLILALYLHWSDKVVYYAYGALQITLVGIFAYKLFMKWRLTRRK